MGSSYAARVLCTRLQIAHSNVCKSTPGRASAILTSIIGALRFGQAGRSIATNGMTDDRRGRCSPQSPAPGFGEKYGSLSGFPSHSLESGGGAFLTVIFGQIFRVFRIQRQPFLE